jgi:O-antigen/teichoic acid export membrane protein
MIASGVLTYAFHILAARTLGPTAYGQIAVLWGAMFLAAIVLFRPVEQTTSRALADRLARGEEGRSVIRAAAVMAVVLILVAAVVMAAAWTTLTSRLFLGDNVMTVALCAGIGAYGLSYLVRGVLGGTRWFGGYSLGLMADAVVRLAVAIPLVLVASKLTAAAAVVAAGLAGALVPLFVGRRRLTPIVAPGPGEPFRIRHGVAFAGPATAIAAADQLFVNGGPLLIILAGGIGASRSAGIVFVAPGGVPHGDVHACLRRRPCRRNRRARPRTDARAVRREVHRDTQ